MATHRVFTAEEFGDALNLTSSSRDSLLAYYRQRGRILRIRRGLYWVLRTGETPESCSVDPFLVAARMTEDAVLAYHTALEFHARAYSVFSESQYQTARAARAATFRGWRFRPVSFPKALQQSAEPFFGVEEHDRSGQSVRVTGLERTLVDALDRPELCGGWEELWRSLEMVEFFDLEQVVEYALLLNKATTVGKVGWFLDLHRDSLMVQEDHLRILRERRPRQPTYIARRDYEKTRFIAEWNLVVPQALVERSWSEVA
nr:type IV toxin-antitoxin system AbiEi family antitoxin domain-containing protein [Halorhodospira halochloris]